jgi:hypothetical protein
MALTLAAAGSATVFFFLVEADGVTASAGAIDHALESEDCLIRTYTDLLLLLQWLRSSLFTSLGCSSFA